MDTNITSSTRNRTFSLYATKLSIPGTDSNNVNWSIEYGQIIYQLLKKIINLPVDKKIYTGDKNDNWTMALEKCELNRTNNPSYIRGYFSCTKDGFHTQLLDNKTFERTPNPKGLTQNEIMRTAFSFRLKDGLFTLGEYKDNIATAKRIATYLNSFIKKFVESEELQTDITRISFIHCISEGFLDKINSFDRLNSASITMEVPQLIEENEDSFSTLNHETSGANIGTVTIVLKRKRGDSAGLNISKIKQWITKLTDLYNPIKGELKGCPHVGNTNKLTINGVNKCFKYSLKLGTDGDVLLSELYDKIEQINENCESIF